MPFLHIQRFLPRKVDQLSHFVCGVGQEDNIYTDSLLLFSSIAFIA